MTTAIYRQNTHICLPDAFGDKLVKYRGKIVEFTHKQINRAGNGCVLSLLLSTPCDIRRLVLALPCGAALYQYIMPRISHLENIQFTFTIQHDAQKAVRFEAFDMTAWLPESRHPCTPA